MVRLPFVSSSFLLQFSSSCSFWALSLFLSNTLRTPRVTRKLVKSSTMVNFPMRQAVKTRKTRLVTVTISMYGQILRRTVDNSGSGSALSLGLKIRKARDDPHDKERIDVSRLKICVQLGWPVLRTIPT